MVAFFAFVDWFFIFVGSWVITALQPFRFIAFGWYGRLQGLCKAGSRA
jgi:hypothetical protein